MIVAKPRFNTLFSFGLFLAISAFVLIINIRILLTEPEFSLLRISIVILLLPICLYLLYRIFLQYKRISVGKKKIKIEYPIRGKAQTYDLKQIESWKEESVKTGKNNYYKELIVKFSDGEVLKMGLQEYTEYKKIISYLSEHVTKKQIS
ncbi:MAG TPA: hypothetical protein PKC24_01865 [Cyclobacteriaceae bacterium]|nr:hypothetical protein [Cyclobacteriaceae bacterium]